jgi:hypothetical protein
MKIRYNPKLIAGFLSLIIIAITWQTLHLSGRSFDDIGITYTHYNNYVIFKQSFFHLIHQQDLYQLYPTEHWDLYKYSPTFPLFMLPMAVLPDTLGLIIWTSLNVFVLFWGIWNLPGLTDKSRVYVLGFLLIELITSIQNFQSNGLIVGMLVWAFILFERRKNALAVLLIVLTVFIKLFGMVALIMLLFYPNKWKSIKYTAFWSALLAVLPLIVVPVKQLSFLYQSWFVVLQQDHTSGIELSVERWLHIWFGMPYSSAVVLVGAALLCLPLIQYRFFDDLKFRLLYLAAILIWVVIFNHKAESPTYVIAITGVAIWFFSQKANPINILLVITAFLFTVLSSTDIFPRSIQSAFVAPYVIKAVPCILIWGKIMFELMFYGRKVRP